jgi:hypothetical protein
VGLARAVTVFAKLGIAIVLSFIALMVVRRTSLGDRLANRWAAHRCAGRVEADLQSVVWFQQPKVLRCEGDPRSALCMVETREPDGGRKIGPVSGWDCSVRHISDSDRAAARSYFMRYGMGNAPATHAAEVGATKLRVFLQAIQYVGAKMKQREELLE